MTLPRRWVLVTWLPVSQWDYWHVERWAYLAVAIKAAARVQNALDTTCTVIECEEVTW